MEVAGWEPAGGGAAVAASAEPRAAAPGRAAVAAAASAEPEPAGCAPTVPDTEGAAAAAAGLEAGAAADEQDVDNDEATADIFGSYRPQAVRRPQRTRQPCRPAVSDRRCRSGRRSSTGWLAPTPRCWWRPPRSPAARWPERTRPPRATRAPQVSVIRRVPARRPSYTLAPSLGTICKGRLSAPQLETCRLACQRHTSFLPDGRRAGFLLGDGAGVGKGRQLAAIILDSYLRGHKREHCPSAPAPLYASPAHLGRRRGQVTSGSPCRTTC
eukprot:COSAG04_NODE_3533_length_2732_cov_13.411162_2_plen_270_part_00